MQSIISRLIIIVAVCTFLSCGGKNRKDQSDKNNNDDISNHVKTKNNLVYLTQKTNCFDTIILRSLDFLIFYDFYQKHYLLNLYF